MVYKFPSWPIHDSDELEGLSSVLQSGEWWSGKPGGIAENFEQEFADIHGATAGVLTTNGTHALELALRLLAIGPGDEVIIPAMTFMATATAVLCVGATPVSVDICSKTWCLDPQAFENAITDKTKAVIPVHFGGQICRMDEISQISASSNLHVIEDAAHAHGGSRSGQMAGSFGIAAAFSFQNYKLITSGEGGILLINDEKLLERARRMTNCGRGRGEFGYNHSVLGSNFRITNFQAAILHSQLRRLDDLAQKRQFNGALLDNALRDIPGIEPQGEEGNGRHSRYMYLFTYVPDDFGGLTRDEFVQELSKRGIPANSIYPRIQDAPFLIDTIAQKDPCKISENIAKSGIWIHHRTLIGSDYEALQIRDAIVDIRNHL